MKSLTLICLTIVFLSSSCTNSKYDNLYPTAAGTTCDTSGTISYAKDITPIIVANCYGAGTSCHNTGGISGFDYTTYSGVIVNVPSGALLNDINQTPLRGDNPMPKDANKLDQCSINKITKWISEGYPNN